MGAERRRSIFGNPAPKPLDATTAMPSAAPPAAPAPPPASETPPPPASKPCSEPMTTIYVQLLAEMPRPETPRLPAFATHPGTIRAAFAEQRDMPGMDKIRASYVAYQNRLGRAQGRDASTLMALFAAARELKVREAVPEMRRLRDHLRMHWRWDLAKSLPDWGEAKVEAERHTRRFETGGAL